MRSGLVKAVIGLLCGIYLAYTAEPSIAESTQIVSITIVLPTNASPRENLAAHEVRRYLYLRTGRLLTIREQNTPPTEPSIVVARANRPIVKGLLAVKLEPQEYMLRTVTYKGNAVALVTGGSDEGVLYGAYRLAKRWGVRFGLDSDIVPDGHVRIDISKLNERGKPLFDLRGIQPFHDFAEGPDWWNVDDYRAIISQLPKLGMNFIGLHTYPEPIAEPTVWIGPSSEIGANGHVNAAYSSNYHNTARNSWGYQPKKTSAYAFGAANLFDRDDYSADVMRDFCPSPGTSEACAALFNRTGDMLRDAFSYAHNLGVKTCVGTETPLTIPQELQTRLRAEGKDPADQKVAQELYTGIFKRISATYPIDYYWLWTPEGWTWSGTTPEQEKATIGDLQSALTAHKEAHVPFKIATCGWVLGPPSDRAAFDRLLPKDAPMSCINRQVGNEPVEQGFAHITGRPKWAIPWMEDDPGLTEPQLWAGRMREDASDALKYGCTGLMGIHWRTRVIGPNVAALAEAGWTQTGWRTTQPADGPIGGSVASFPSAQIADAQDPELYRSVRYNMKGYRLALPNGAYTVTLRFCEPAYDKSGVRVFDVSLQGKTVIENLDIFAKVGKNRALDYTFKDIQVTNGHLEIGFPPRVEYPCIAAIEVVGATTSKRINCGGSAHADYAADPDVVQRGLPVADFYLDWAKAQFGENTAKPIAELFTRLDGKLPRPLEWTDGPGGLTPDGRGWEESRKDYAFVAEFTKFKPKIKGAANRERYRYWLEQFEYMQAVAKLRCHWAEFNRSMADVKLEHDPDAVKHIAQTKALPVRIALVAQLQQVYKHLLATVGTTGELGNVTNWEQHILPSVIDGPGRDLSDALGTPLPITAVPSPAYDGPVRIIVPTVRRSLFDAEPLNLRVLILSADAPRGVTLCWKPMGSKRYARVPLTHVARGVYEVKLLANQTAMADFEYYIEAVSTDNTVSRWPATAPAIGQTVVRMVNGPLAKSNPNITSVR